MQIEKAYYWPGWLIESLSPNANFQSQKQFFGKTQIHLWRALNIYDDFLDSEGKPSELPQGNFNFRIFLKNIYTSNLPAFFLKWAENKLTLLEKANEREALAKKLKIKNGSIDIPKKLPSFTDLSRLSDKSLALAIAPIAANIKTDTIKTIAELKILDNLFKYALAAKQLSDDACDWFEDLNNGSITAVTVLILKMAKKKKIQLNLKKRPEIIYLLFVEAAAEKTCYNLLNLCGQARNEAKKINISDNAPIIINLLRPLELAAQKALDFKKML